VRTLRRFWVSPLRLCPPPRVCRSFSPTALRSSVPPADILPSVSPTCLCSSCILHRRPRLWLLCWVCVVAPPRTRHRESILVAALPLVSRLVIWCSQHASY